MIAEINFLHWSHQSTSWRSLRIADVFGTRVGNDSKNNMQKNGQKCWRVQSVQFESWQDLARSKVKLVFESRSNLIPWTHQGVQPPPSHPGQCGPPHSWDRPSILSTFMTIVQSFPIHKHIKIKYYKTNSGWRDVEFKILVYIQRSGSNEGYYMLYELKTPLK